jgi:hypothetical protein
MIHSTLTNGLILTTPNLMTNGISNQQQQQNTSKYCLILDYIP